MTDSELLLKWSPVIDRMKIPTWTEPLTLAYLAELASKSNWMIECGTYLGGSAKVMLMANPKLKLICIDIFNNRGEPWMLDYLRSIGEPADPEKTIYGICRNHSLKTECDESRCLLVGGNSEIGAGMLRDGGYLDGSIDAIWIDDGHETKQVMADIRYMMPFLKPGGEMVGHDFDVPHNDVAQGVIGSGIAYDVPIPRMWRHFKPKP